MEVALRDAINRGDILGPRYFTTGYHLTVTGGHGYFLPPWLANISVHPEQSTIHCDGPNEWRKAARLNLYNGTDNVKIVASRVDKKTFLLQEKSRVRFLIREELQDRGGGGEIKNK